MAFLSGVDLNTPFADGQIPFSRFIVYQMMFAIITPALITGAFANRCGYGVLHFPHRLADLRLLPLVHMVWATGCWRSGASGTSPAGSWCMRPRALLRSPRCSSLDREQVKDRGPHSIPLVALGTGLLWFGWYGFNAAVSSAWTRSPGLRSSTRTSRLLLPRGPG